MPAAIPTAIIGAGRLTRTLAPLLPAAGYPIVGIAARRRSAARSACGGLSGVRITTRPERAVERARLVLLAVTDRALAEVSRRLAATDIEWSSRTVLHHAGALGSEPLQPLARLGAGVGVMHPLQTLAGDATVLAGSFARVEGDARGRRAALRLARALELRPLRLPATLGADDRAAYHAAGSLMSNDIVALTAIGVGLLESLGIGRRASLEALIALARGTLAQLERGGLRGALTGPAVRGDTETLRAHLRSLARQSDEDARTHALASRRLARLAASLGELSPAQLRRILRSIGPDSRGTV